MVWHSHLFKNFLQFVVIHTVKGFSLVNEGEVDFFFSEFSCFFYYPVDVGSLISGSSACLKSSLYTQLVYLEVLGSRIADASLKDFEHHLASM